MSNKPLIMIVEDDEKIKDFLRAKLQVDGYNTISVTTGKSAISLAASHCPDVVLLDLGLPDMDGMEVLHSIRSWSALPVIVISARQHENAIVKALDANADDYITKPFNNSVLMARIRTALRKGIVQKTNQTNMYQTFDGGNLRIDYDKRMVFVDGEEVHLTPLEYKMISFLAQHAGRVMTYSAICRHLWGPYGGDNCTLRVNMTNVRRKIEANSADPKYLFTEMGVGYRMLESD